MFLIEPDRDCNCEFVKLQIATKKKQRDTSCDAKFSYCTLDVGDGFEEDQAASYNIFYGLKYLRAKTLYVL